MSEENKDKKKNGTLRKILIVIAILMILIGLGSFGFYLYGQYDASHQEEPTSAVGTSTVEVTDETGKIKNPVDFAKLKDQNEEIYAWLKVPGTKVDHPLCQSRVADDFYLKHNAYDKKYQSNGAIYTQSLNTTTFRDRVTVIYGHNGYGDTMFTTLHKFEKKDFFDKHKYFYIYTPDSKLTYQIVSAFKYDDRHILNSFQMQNDTVFRDFLGMIQDPDSSNKNVRKAPKELTIDDNIVILSTCITNQKSNRYLICGVLVNNEATD